MINPYLGEKTEIIGKRCETHVDYKFTLKSSLKPRPGQFIKVSIPKAGECPISISDFGEDWLEITVRRAGRVTSALHSLHTGDYIYVRGPYGSSFPIDRYRGKHLVIIAGGIGLAPVKSIIQHYTSNPGEIQKMDLLAGFRSPGDIILNTELQKWKYLFNVIVSVDEGENWDDNKGFITDYIDSLYVNDPVNTEVIIVGPSEMMNQAVLGVSGLGVPEENITFSLERRMSCGIGKCGHCRINDTYVCVDGPVFNYTKVRNFID